MYGKVFASMYDGTLATKGPWQALVTFQQMIVLADRDGVVDMTADAISRRTSLPIEIINRGIAELSKPDDESRSQVEDGRRIVLLEEHRTWGWQIVNYAKYAALRSAEERRDYMRVAQAEHRAKVKAAAELSKNVMTSQDKVANVKMSTDVDVDVPVPVEVKTKTARKRAAPAVLVSVDDMAAEGVDRQHATDWLLNRKTKDLAPLTPSIWAATKAEAAKAGLTVHAAIQEAAGAGWGGFKASWLADGRARNTDPFAGAA